MTTQPADTANKRTDSSKAEGAARGVSMVRSAEAQRAAYELESGQRLEVLLAASNRAADSLISGLRARTSR